MTRRSDPKSQAKGRAGLLLRLALLAVLVLVAGVLGWCRWVYVQIESYASQDQAAPSDAIGVFGAAEYDGRPRPSTERGSIMPSSFTITALLR